jgi:hypothetical protein
MYDFLSHDVTASLVDGEEQRSFRLSLVVGEVLAILRKEIFKLTTFGRLFGKWSKAIDSE